MHLCVPILCHIYVTLAIDVTLDYDKLMLTVKYL